MTYVLESNLSDRRLLLAKLEDILADQEESLPMDRTTCTKEIHSGIERRYDTGHSSMWGGRIAAHDKVNSLEDETELL